MKTCVIGIAVEEKSVAAYDISKGEHIENEEEGAKHQALRDTWVTGVM